MNYRGITVGLLMGFTGGGLLLFLMTDPFKLYYLGGYLGFLTLILTVFCAIKIYRTSSQLATTYWKRVRVGLLSYSSAILSLTIYQILKGQIELSKVWMEESLPPLFLIHMAAGLALSLLLSIEFKRDPKEKK